MVRRVIVAVFLLAVWAFPAEATSFWWYTLHCAGSASSHGSGNSPQHETDSENGTTQCHGKPGDVNNCNQTAGVTVYGVACTSETKPNGSEQNICVASTICPGSGPNLSCGGIDQQAFAGMIEIAGVSTGFIECSGPGGTTRAHC